MLLYNFPRTKIFQNKVIVGTVPFYYQNLRLANLPISFYNHNIKSFRNAQFRLLISYGHPKF